MSVESEYVLVPREPTDRMLNAADGWTDLIDAAGGNTAESRKAEFRTAWSAMLRAAPAPSPSPAAKGGKAEAMPCPFCGSPAKLIHPMGEWLGNEKGYGPNGSRYVCSALYDNPSRDCEGRGVSHGPDQDAEALACWNTRVALATPSPQPANAVREAMVKALDGQTRFSRDCSLSKVEVDGRVIPCLTMHYNGQDGHASLVLDGRWEIDVPFEYAERVAWMIANANAIGQGYSHLGAPNKDKPYAPEVRGGNHLIPSAPQEPSR